jgi:hypothetical protein
MIRTVNESRRRGQNSALPLVLTDERAPMTRLRPFAAVAAFMAVAAPALAADIEVAAPASGGADLTVYTNDLAMVRERRTFKLTSGGAQLAFTGVSSQLQPQTAFLSPIKGNIKITEQSFNFDLLTPEKLLARAVGSDVTVITTNPATGADKPTRAKVLSVANGLVLQIDGKIHTNVPGRIVFDSLPVGVRAAPTLLMSVTGAANQEIDAELGYLTGGLSWRADYVMQFDPDTARMDLTALATVTNTTGQDFRDAKLKLVTGAVKRLGQPRFERPMAAQAMTMAKAAPAPMAEGVSEESFVGNHIYTIPKATTIAASESKQLALLNAQNVAVKRDFVLRSQPSFYTMSMRDRPLDVPVQVELTFKNDTAAKLGAPLPAGVVRVYSPDEQGAPRFVGEASIDHVAVGNDAIVRVGQDYDLTATREQVNFVRATDNIFLSVWRITIKNAQNKPAVVRVIEPMPGTWEVTKESAGHKKVDSGSAEWTLPVPPKGQTVLEYSLKTQL